MNQKNTATPTDAFLASYLWSTPLLSHFFKGCKNSQRAARAYLARQQEAGMIASAVVDVYPTPDISEPLISPARCVAESEFARIAYQAELRWSVASIPQRVYWPTTKFANLYGSWTGQDRLVRPETANHDLLVSAVWLVYLRRHPVVALTNWISERKLQFDRLRNLLTTPVPDALIVLPGRKVAVEVIGAYPANYIRRHCRRFKAAGWFITLW